jgi:hypothetical protein
VENDYIGRVEEAAGPSGDWQYSSCNVSSQNFNLGDQSLHSVNHYILCVHETLLSVSISLLRSREYKYERVFETFIEI